MKRLYNEHSACPYEGSAKEIDDIISKAFRDIWNVVEKDDLCPRDTSHYCNETLLVLFAQEILRTAMDKRRKERNEWQSF
jgi:hypothetical protein